jgi:hypothetical protein
MEMIEGDGIKYCCKLKNGSYLISDEITGGTSLCELSDLKNDLINYGKALDKRCSQILDMVSEDQREEVEWKLKEIYYTTFQIYVLKKLINEECPETSDHEVTENDNHEVAGNAIYLDEDDLLRELDSM